MLKLPQSPWIQRSIRLLIALACTYQAAAVFFMSYPNVWPLQARQRVPFADYMRLTRQQQSWNMFVTWDPWQSVEAKIHVRTDEVGELEFGALMPGYREGPGGVRDQIFYQAAFLNPTGRWRPYLRKVCRDLERDMGLIALSVRVRMQVQEIRPIQMILKDDIPSVAKSWFVGPVRCAAGIDP